MQNDHFVLLQGGFAGGFARLLLMKKRPPYKVWVPGLIVGIGAAYYFGGALSEYFNLQPKVTGACAFLIGSMGEAALVFCQKLAAKRAEQVLGKEESNDDANG